MTSRKNFLMRAASWAAHTLPPSLKKCLYRIPFVAAWLRRSLNKAAPQGITQVEIAGGLSAGLHMALNLQTEKDYWLGTYEPDLQDAAKHFIKPGMTVYDVGANIGYISLLAARLNSPDGRVIAFEALPANIQRLTQNVTLNQLEKRVSVQHAAVVDTVGKVTFYMHRSGAMGKAAGSAGRDEQYQQSIQVDGIALDDFIFKQNQPKPDLVKLDIEGGEGMALAGMSRTLQEIRPVFLIELHGEQAARQVWDILTANHYNLHRMRHGFPKINSLQELDWKAYVVALVS